MSDLAIDAQPEAAEAGAARYWAFASMWAIAEVVHLLNQSRGRLTSVFEWVALAVIAARHRSEGGSAYGQPTLGMPTWH